MPDKLVLLEDTGQLKAALPVVTTVADPGADTNIPTEQAVREAIAVKVSGPPSSVVGHLATFADMTGKVIQDGGAALISGGWFEVDDNGDLEPSMTFLLSNTLEADVNGDLMPV